MSPRAPKPSRASRPRSPLGSIAPRAKDHHLALIEEALNEIEEGLRAPLDLDALARQVGLSYWHFQRVFGALAGEPVGSYLRRRRLTAAAQTLRETSGRILDVALEYQFESHSAFTRAFRGCFGLSPEQYRRQPGPLLAGRKRLTGDRLRRLQRIQAEPEIVTLPAVVIEGLSCRFICLSSERTNNTLVIPRLWQRFVAQLPEAFDGERYGAWRPLAQDERQDPDEQQYLAGVAVATTARPVRGRVRWTAEAGHYARFVHRGSMEGISDTIDYIYAVWLPRNGGQRRSGCDLERYDHRFQRGSPASEMDYLVPLE